MNMLRHNHISRNIQTVPTSHQLQLAFEDPTCAGGIQTLLPAVAGESDKVQTLGLLKATQAAWHGEDATGILPPCRSKRKRQGWGSPNLGIMHEEERVGQPASQ